MTANVTQAKSNSNRETSAAALVHIVGLFFGFFAISFVYLASDEGFVKENAANALNWHVPLSLLAVLVVVIGIGVSEIAGVAISILIAVTTICFALVASVNAYRGRAWNYPVVPQMI